KRVPFTHHGSRSDLASCIGKSHFSEFVAAATSDRPSRHGSGSSSQVGSGQVGAVMSALGQKRTSPNVRPMSALPPKADIRYGDRHVRFVPKADIGIAYRCGLRAGTRDEAANLGVAVTVVIGPHNGRAETVGFSHNGVVRYHKPFSMNAD